MTSYAHHPQPIRAPDFREWTRAHQIADADRRRVALSLLHDRLAASRMTPVQARVYLSRHVLGWALRWALLGVFALCITPWAWLPIVGLPAYGLVKAWRGSRHGQ